MRQALGQQFAFAYQAKLKSEFENNQKESNHAQS